jgi:hypothetical protein
MRPRIGAGQNPFYFFNRTPLTNDGARRHPMHFDVDKVVAPSLRRKIGYI